MDYFKIVSIFLLIFCFSIQVWDGFMKFIKRQTTVVSTTKTLSNQILPAFSFCPGFKDDNLRSFHGVEEPYNLPFDRAGKNMALECLVNV